MNKYYIDKIAEDIRLILSFKHYPPQDIGRYKVSGTVTSGIKQIDGIRGKAYYFPGVSGERVQLPYSAEVLDIRKQTLMFWVKAPYPSQGTGNVFHAISDKFYCWHCCLHYDNEPYHIHRSVNVGGGRDWVSRNSFNHGGYHFVITTYDGLCGKIWIDGVLSVTIWGSYSLIPINTNLLNIGDRQYTGRPTKCILDDYVLSGQPISDSKAYILSRHPPSFELKGEIYTHVHTDGKSREVGVVSVGGVM